MNMTGAFGTRLPQSSSWLFWSWCIGLPPTHRASGSSNDKCAGDEPFTGSINNSKAVTPAGRSVGTLFTIAGCVQRGEGAG